MSNSNFPFSTAESFLLQLWFELGFFAIALAILTWISIIVRANNVHVTAYLSAIAFSALTVPALYSQTGFLLSGAILILILRRKNFG